MSAPAQSDMLIGPWIEFALSMVFWVQPGPLAAWALKGLV